MQTVRQLLLGPCQPAIDSAHRVKDIDQLRDLLQSAIKLEHTTIPPYLCALYSIREGTNLEAAEVILSVVMEEMLHLVLAANVLNAIGGKPSINQKVFVPQYPQHLAPVGIDVHLEPFSKAAIDAFIEIERPDDSVRSQPPIGCRHFEEFQSIAQFYELIVLGLEELSAQGNIFTGNPDHQIGPEHYYGSGGAARRVTDLTSAVAALNEIIGQGEGIPHSVWGGPNPNPARANYLEVAHFYRFVEIREERRYRGDEPVPPPNGKYPLPLGEKFHVAWDDVYPMRKNPTVADLPPGRPIDKKATQFNRTYMSLLNALHTATNGQPDVIKSSVVIMYELKYQAIELMRIPMPDNQHSVGPSFEYLAP